jgi:hypothetical protein
MSFRINRIHHRLMILPVIGFLAILSSTAIFAQSANSPVTFENLPFKAWLDGKNTSQISWTVLVRSHGLSDYQRLQATVSAVVFLNSKEISDGTGKLLCAVRLTDAQGKAYETNRTLDVRVPPPDQSPKVTLSFGIYLLPGEYQVAIAMYSTATRKHNVSHQVLHVAPIPNDPLPSAWANLPTVEFFPMRAPAGLVDDELQLPLQTNQSVRLEILANVTPTYAYKPSTLVYRWSLAALYAELNVMSQIAVKNGSLDVSVLALDEQKIAFEQNDVRKLDGGRLWRVLMEHNSNAIDATAMVGETREASFFISEVKQRLSGVATTPGMGAANMERVIIVLSNEMAFPKGEDLSPISLERECGCRVFYIRGHVVLDPNTHALRFPLPWGAPTWGSPIDPDIGQQGSPPIDAPPTFPPSKDRSTDVPNVDQLENTLAPLQPRVFDVKSPEDFRKAVAAILKEIGNS